MLVQPYLTTQYVKKKRETGAAAHRQNRITKTSAWNWADALLVFPPRQSNFFCFNNTEIGIKEEQERSGATPEHGACSALTLQIRYNVIGFKRLHAPTADVYTTLGYTTPDSSHLSDDFTAIIETKRSVHQLTVCWWGHFKTYILKGN